METAAFVLLGAFLGMVGGILNLLTIRQQSEAHIGLRLLAGCVVGTLASIALLGIEVNNIVMVAIIALGYAGTDLIMSLLGR